MGYRFLLKFVWFAILRRFYWLSVCIIWVSELILVYIFLGIAHFNLLIRLKMFSWSCGFFHWLACFILCLISRKIRYIAYVYFFCLCLNLLTWILNLILTEFLLFGTISNIFRSNELLCRETFALNHLFHWLTLVFVVAAFTNLGRMILFSFNFIIFPRKNLIHTGL